MPKTPILIFGRDISHLPRGCIFMIGCLGIFILYIVYGGVQVSGFENAVCCLYFHL